MANGTFTNFDKDKDTRTINSKVSLQISGALPATRQNGDGTTVVFPPGYKRTGEGVLGFTWFTFNTSSQFVDVSWGIRSASFEDANSMFYRSNRNPAAGSAPAFTDDGKLSVSKTASMIYQSWATILNDGSTLDVDGKAIDLLGVLNFKRAQYRDRIQPGTFNLAFRASSSTADRAASNLVDDGLRKIHDSVAGQYTDILNRSQDPDLKVGKLYLDRGIAVLDLFKLFFPSSLDRDITRRSELLPFITGSGDLGFNCGHKIGFFSGSNLHATSTGNTEAINKRLTYDHAEPADILNFYSGSYSQSLNTFTRDLVGVRTNANVNFKTKLYFCRALSGDFNYSANPTFTTGSTLHNQVYRTPEPETFITTTGLFNDSGELLAVGKLSQPLRKNFGSETVIRLRLDF